MLPLVLAVFVGIAAATPNDEKHVNATLEQVRGSGITGNVEVTQLHGGGTQITIHVEGLTPGTEYVSLYYENGTCELEKYEEDDILGRYTANPSGKANITVKAADDLDEIKSISVRLNSDFSLLSCAALHSKE
jgi:Cu/Zn superoxide dismutase